MAEQIHHNVVNQPESTSGSPLVDAAVNSIITDSALGSYSSSTVSKFETDHVDSSNIAAETSNFGDVSALDSRVTEEKVGSGHFDLVNGIHDDGSQGEGLADDRSTADISVDVSVNSDTDTSRADAAEKKEDSYHARTSSVKKPTTFSKVSVTKNFLAKTATVTPLITKIGDKRKH